MPGMTKAGYTPEKMARPQKTKQPKTPEKKPGKKKKRRRVSRAAIASLLVFAVAFAVGALTLHVFSSVERYQNAFSLGVMLDGQPIGGMSAEDGAAVLEKKTADKVSAWRFDIQCMDKTYVLTATDVGLFVDKQATLEPLWQVGKTGSLLESYLEMLRTQAMRLNGQIVLGYSMEPVDALLAQIKAETDCGPVDATMTYTPHNSVPFRFTDEEMGYELDTAALRQQIETAIVSLTPGSAELNPKELAPRVTRAQLESAITLRARVQLTLDSDEGSLANVRIASGMLGGARIEAGETLSFNTLVGRRTKEGGYVSAPEPAYGMDVSGTGGGVCQVSTALYQAALLAGLPVEQRHAAVRPVAYCEIGQEATVSDTGLDLVIRNDTASPVYITARVYVGDNDAQMLELQLIGERMDKRYALASSSQETEATQDPVYMEDKTGQFATYRDERVPGGDAQPGYAATVERVTLGEGGEAAEREIISQDEYAPIGPIIYVGTQERE